MLSDTHAYDEYWKFKNYHHMHKSQLVQNITSQGRYASDTWAKGLLVEKLLACNRGIPDYANTSAEDLRRFVRDRGLREPHSEFPLADRIDYVAVLKAADEEQYFSKMKDLPPELRERIYKMYLAMFLETLWFPSQPPLTRTCRLFRTEVLPLFYRHTTFKLFFCDDLKANLQRQTERLWPCVETAFFVNCLPMGVCKLEFIIGSRRNWSRQREAINTEVHCRISTDNSSEKCSVTVEPTWGQAPSEQSTRARQVLQKKIFSQLKAICGDAHSRRLSIREISLLRDAAAKGYHSGWKK